MSRDVARAAAGRTPLLAEERRRAEARRRARVAMGHRKLGARARPWLALLGLLNLAVLANGIWAASALACVLLLVVPGLLLLAALGVPRAALARASPCTCPPRAWPS